MLSLALILTLTLTLALILILILILILPPPLLLLLAWLPSCLCLSSSCLWRRLWPWLRSLAAPEDLSKSTGDLIESTEGWMGRPDRPFREGGARQVGGTSNWCILYTSRVQKVRATR